MGVTVLFFAAVSDTESAHHMHFLPGFANTPNLAWILRQNCSDDSTEVTEGVTSTPEIFGNKHSFVLTFFTTNAIYVIVNIVNLN